MTSDEYHALIHAGVVDGVELRDDRVWMGAHPLAFSASQVAPAERLGIVLPSPVDVVLSDPGLRAQVIARLAREG